MIDYQERRTMMVDTQVRPNDVAKYNVIAAMLEIPREEFVPDSRRDVAYVGENIEIARGRVLLEPRTIAKMIDTLDLQPTELVLNLAAGYGYAAAVLGRLAQAVVAVEEDAEMAAEATRRLAGIGADNVAVVQGPLAAGHKAEAPYDAILIEGGIEELPAPLAAQLVEGGRHRWVDPTAFAEEGGVADQDFVALDVGSYAAPCHRGHCAG